MAGLSGNTALGANRYPGDPKGDTNITFNIQNVAFQMQQVLVDFMSYLPDDKRQMFQKRIAAIEVDS